MYKFLLIILFLFAAGRAEALNTIDIDYTGHLRERIDLCGYGCGNVSTTAFSSNLLNAGGPVANNSVGYAQQFTIDEKIEIDYLLASAHIFGDSFNGQPASNSFYFKLYTNTSTVYHDEPSAPYPDVYSMKILTPFYIEASKRDVFFPDLGITHTFYDDATYKDVPLPFHVTLNPGTYWIAQERYKENTGFGIADGPQFRVDSISVKFAEGKVSTVPEPSTILLLGGGLAGAIWRRRKVTKA